MHETLPRSSRRVVSSLQVSGAPLPYAGILHGPQTSIRPADPLSVAWSRVRLVFYPRRTSSCGSLRRPPRRSPPRSVQMLRRFPRRTRMSLLPSLQLPLTRTAKFAFVFRYATLGLRPATPLAVLLLPGNRLVSRPATIFLFRNFAHRISPELSVRNQRSAAAPQAHPAISVENETA